MKDKICVVTGANSGIGKVTARELAKRGARVVLGCRDMDKGAAALEEIKREANSDAVTLLPIDLASLASVRAFVASFQAEFDHLDVLVNNAGAYIPKRYETEDGFEMTMGVNHLAPVLLTALLRDALEAAPAARIVNVSSMGHKMARLDLDDLHSKQSFGAMRAYCNSKLANILHVKALCAQLQADGVTANCLHPGVVGSGFAQDESSAFGFMVKLGKPFIMSPEKGARTSIFLATSPDVEGVSGEYFVRQKMAKPSRAGRNIELAERLQSMSEQMVGLA
jgi:NAD(P)-dependent dehydrogenase (short-subunit alcohol dehydrogenase family)